MPKRPRCTRWKSPGMPPGSAEYMFIGETTTRFGTTICPTRNGVNIGGGGWSSGTSKPCSRTVPANQRCTFSTNCGSRIRRFS